MLLKYIEGYSPEFIGDEHIDIAIEFNIDLFKELGLNCEIDEGYINNELGSFYVNDNGICWFWAITNKKPNSRKFDSVGKFYLTDGETCTRIPRTKIWQEFKKAITPKLNKALKKFAKEEGLI